MRRSIFWFAIALMLPFSVIRAQQKAPLPEVDAAGLKKAVAAQRGEVVFVNFWATWCAPCVAEFPDVVKLYNKYHARGLEVIAVSFDEDASVPLPFLKKQNAEFINLLKKPADENFAQFDNEWGGALPASWLFDQNGARVYYRQGKFDPVALDAKIAQLLAGQKK